MHISPAKGGAPPDHGTAAVRRRCKVPARRGSGPGCARDVHRIFTTRRRAERDGSLDFWNAVGSYGRERAVIIRLTRRRPRPERS
jgi:hypothetical protein